MNLLLVALQTLDAIVAAGAAWAMWRATVNLVPATRGLVFVNVAPNLRFQILNSQPFTEPKDAVVVLRNHGSVDVVDVRGEIGPSFLSNDSLASTKTVEPFGTSRLGAGKDLKIDLWKYAKIAKEKQKQL